MREITVIVFALSLAAGCLSVVACLGGPKNEATSHKQHRAVDSLLFDGFAPYLLKHQTIF